MVINNTQRDRLSSDNDSYGLGNNPNNRQTEAYSNTKNRGSYFGMNEGRLIEPDQTPALTAIEDNFNNENSYKEGSDNFYDENSDEYEKDENGEKSNRNNKIDKKGQIALKQAELKSNEEDGKKSQFFRKLAQKTWINTQKKLQITEAVNKAKEILSEGGEKVSTDELIELAQQPKQTAPFPLEIFLMALVKDVLDAPLESGIVTTVAGQIISIIIAAILFIWTFSKISGWFGIKKRIIRIILIYFAGTTLVEFIPFLRILPAETAYVLLTHYSESKFVKLLNLALDVLDKKNVIKLIENLNNAKALRGEDDDK